MSKAELWWRGPKWLPYQERWPLEIVTESSAESKADAKAVRKVFAIAMNEVNEIDNVLQKFPLQKAVRVCVWIRRFALNSLRS